MLSEWLDPTFSSELFCAMYQHMGFFIFILFYCICKTVKHRRQGKVILTHKPNRYFHQEINFFLVCFVSMKEKINCFRQYRNYFYITSVRWGYLGNGHWRKEFSHNVLYAYEYLIFCLCDNVWRVCLLVFLLLSTEIAEQFL